jgi:hypothetical protein
MDTAPIELVLKNKEQEKVKKMAYDTQTNYGNRIVIRKIARDMQS